MATTTDLPFEMLSITAADSGLTITDIPFEILSITAADSCLTNRDRKQARLACRKLAEVMTPVIFRRAYLSRIKADRDAFLSLANTPHLAAHVKEIIWFELEIDVGSFNEGDQREVELADGRWVNLFLAAQDIFWLPVEPKYQCNRDDNGEIVYRSPPECAIEFLVQFKAAVARMPKLHTFASERMAPRRNVSLGDGSPFEIGLLMRYKDRFLIETWSDFLHIFLETIAEEKGRINKLHCGNELSGSLARVDPRYHAAMPYLMSLELSIVNVFTAIPRHHFASPLDTDLCHYPMDILRDVIFQATELRELNVSVDYMPEWGRWGYPLGNLHGLIVQPPDKVHIWRHLRSLKLGSINGSSRMLLALIKAHVTTLRHLHLDHCCPNPSFAVELSQLEGLKLESIIISDFDVPEMDLVSEEELLRFIHCEDVQNEELAKIIGQGKSFVTHKRHPDKAIKSSEEYLYDFSDHLSEWLSDTDSESDTDSQSDNDSESGPDIASTS